MGYGERRSGGSGGFNRGGGFGGPREMHKATCSECGEECEVPFKPSKNPDGSDRPVYCKNCYQKHKKF
ncbi:MAG: CxxC-x17-CxxC domain-containing protein [archaeon]